MTTEEFSQEKSSVLFYNCKSTTAKINNPC